MTILIPLMLWPKKCSIFFNIPAVGEDKIFGEIFPLELEENRDKFNQRLPFDYLNAESIDPAIPANGHLIWAPTEWWQKQFEQHGLVRAEELERIIHTFFDEHLFYSRKSFYIFHLDSRQGLQRVTQLLKNGLTLFKKPFSLALVIYIAFLAIFGWRNLKAV